ncbi:zinc-binding dehydrogenase [Modestobacter sp. Leaf380]|uniref:zinc-dependent alcohol dehydrogenase family protein n=1 Tax=Modestobacter sp. Leaf380 TaxID=1736356 RepID=UPI0006FAA93C|nr:zinc-binding dehydrogenase [Modestobacter sp. Leaf380]KQS64274.1 iditol 2-dehydrogenase [Modestobacter sp. Leaf380]
MRAVVFLGAGEIELQQRPDPRPALDGVVVRIRASGMCGSDLHHLDGPRRTPDEQVVEGHEPCGVVESVGAAVRPGEARVGDRVMVHHYDGCRTCRHCRSGWTQYCTRGRVVFGGLDGDGGHADLMAVPAHALIALPDELSFSTGAALSCGTGTAFAAIERVALTADETVAVFGQGPVGLSATLLAKAFGARVIAVDVDPARLAMARRTGADHVVDAREGDPVAAVRALTRDGEGVDKSLECSAVPVVRRQAVEALRPWGTACMVGVFGPLEVDSNELIHHRKTIVGSLTASKNQLQDCARFVVDRGLDVESLITHRFPLAAAERAYRLFQRQEIGKGVLLND